MSKYCLKMRPELIQRARALYQECNSYRAVARTMNINRDTVKRWVNPDAIVTPPVVAVQRSSLPTLAFVPHIVIEGRYTMVRHVE